MYDRTEALRTFVYFTVQISEVEKLSHGIQRADSTPYPPCLIRRFLYEKIISILLPPRSLVLIHHLYILLSIHNPALDSSIAAGNSWVVARRLLFILGR
jgi:hypothetical protein